MGAVPTSYRRRAGSSSGAILLALAGACSGTLEEKYPNRIIYDGGILADADPFAPDAYVPDCVASQPSPGDGHHRPGDDCLLCHRQGGGATPFTIGGTLYSDLEGASPVAGATIHLVDGAGQEATMITEDNGNFWSVDSFEFPLRTYASQCPDVVPMLTTISTTGGSCNSAGCHAAGFRVYLP